jgi:V8-like Glu-specific endopeptidase
MSRLVLFPLILLIGSMELSAQMSEGGLPKSLSLIKPKGTSSLPVFKLKEYDRSALTKEDMIHPIPYRYAIFEDMSVDLKLSGKKDTIPDEAGAIWRMKMESDSAFSIQVIFSKFIIPPGASLFIYNEDLTQISGAFTSNNMQEDSTLVIADIIGNKAIIEYFEPFAVRFSGKIIIGSVAKGYKNIYQLKSGTSYININCPEGRDLQLPKHAVCKISFRSRSSSYLCSGSLINIVRQDGTPYFLTASHCINDSAEASTLVAYFNYENEGCTGDALTSRTLSGATLVTTSPASDYSLLKLKKSPGTSYQPYYAGWDASGKAANYVTGIHHPEGLTKKLSVDNDTIVSNDNTIQWDVSSSSPVGSHWQVNFDEGLTAGGSSGSPLFNKYKRIIGQLHGGDDTYDLYGKFSYSWTHTSGKYATLKSFLDPDNTGTLVMDGYSLPGNPPDAFFAVPVSKVCTQAPIQLTDYSAFAPYTRTWSISPATYTFAEGTTKSSANPVIEFLQPGSYSVKLTVSKASGVDSMKIDDAFQAGTTIDVGISTLPSGETCLCNFGHFTAWAYGASAYQWHIEPGSIGKVILNQDIGDTVLVLPVSDLYSDSTLRVNIRVTGTQGTCTDTSVLTYALIKQYNDSIRNARMLQYGKSPILSNKCATVEADEPVPPHFSCTTQNSWCDEYGTGENIVENSVWFKFIAGESGYVSISSNGFDNEIALYSADGYTDILNQNYTLLAANDDRSSTDFNPIIRTQKVTPGNTYWLQVDGSGGGSAGNFSIQLTSLIVTGLETLRTKALIVYPQPAKDILVIQGEMLFSLPAHISIYSITGDLIHEEISPADNGSITLNVSDWKEGIYIAKIASGANLFVCRIVKY